MTAQTSTGTAKVTLPADDQILITREFNAPKHLVYQGLTTPELVKRWWGGDLGTVTVAEIDLRVGGKWRFVQLANEGFEVAFHGEFREIVPNERIVQTEIYEDPSGEDTDPGQGAVNTTTLTESDGRTTLQVLVQCDSKQTRDAIIDSGMEVGMQKSYDLLEQIAVSLS